MFNLTETVLMLKLLFEAIDVVPKAVVIVRDTINAVEASTDTQSRLRAVADGAEKLVAEIRAALG